jgi:hypothetical protein
VRLTDVMATGAVLVRTPAPMTAGTIVDGTHTEPGATLVVKGPFGLDSEVEQPASVTTKQVPVARAAMLP